MTGSLPRLSDLPIPEDVVTASDWPDSLVEMAEHIGAYATLLICDAYGGQQIHIPRDPARSPFRYLIGAEATATFSAIYGGEQTDFPTVRRLLDRVRRAPVMAAVRQGYLTVSDAAQIMGVRRDTASRIFNNTTEGHGVAPLVLPVQRHAAILREVAATVVEELTAQHVDTAIIGRVRDRLASFGMTDAEPALVGVPDATLADWRGKALELGQAALEGSGSASAAYRWATIAARAGATEARALLEPLAEVMSATQVAIAKAHARKTLNDLGYADLTGRAQLPATAGPNFQVTDQGCST